VLIGFVTTPRLPSFQWTGTCIGARNYFSFSAFLWSLVFGLCFMLWCSALMVSGWVANSPTDAFVLRMAAVCVTIPWCIAVLTPVCTLMFFHVYLSCSAKTTNEYFKAKRSKAALGPAQLPIPIELQRDFALTLATTKSPASTCSTPCTPRCADGTISCVMQSATKNTGSNSWWKLASTACGQKDTQLPPMWDDELLSGGENEEV
jgi:hypothetical protein